MKATSNTEILLVTINKIYILKSTVKNLINNQSTYYPIIRIALNKL